MSSGETYHRPKTPESAAAAAAALLRRGLPGKRSAVAVHIRRAESIATAIFIRFSVIPAQWQAKHLRWFLLEECADLSAATRYDYYLTIRNLSSAMGKWENWEPYIRGGWCRPDGVKPEIGGGNRGGRPRLL